MNISSSKLQHSTSTHLPLVTQSITSSSASTQHNILQDQDHIAPEIKSDHYVKKTTELFENQKTQRIQDSAKDIIDIENQRTWKWKRKRGNSIRDAGQLTKSAITKNPATGNVPRKFITDRTNDIQSPFLTGVLDLSKGSIPPVFSLHSPESTDHLFQEQSHTLHRHRCYIPGLANQTRNASPRCRCKSGFYGRHCSFPRCFYYSGASKYR